VGEVGEGFGEDILPSRRQRPTPKQCLRRRKAECSTCVKLRAGSP
jgi:hypothetical protein